jgi:hypothetical protein
MSDIMRAYRRRLVTLTVFGTVFRNVPLEGTNKVVVPYYENDTVASKDFVANDGYVFDQNSATGKREVTVNKRKYKPFDFSSEEFRRQPYFRPEMNMMLKAEQLALDIWLDIISVVTIANFPNSITKVSAGFDVDDVMDVGHEGDLIDWPDVGRSLVLGTTYHTELKKDDSLKHWQNSNSDQTLREGSTGRVDRFDIFQSPRMPDNSEDLTGFAVQPGAILIAVAPIMPAPGVRQQLVNYEIVVDPESGMTLEYRYWGDPDKDRDREVVEGNYGFGVGRETSLIRIIDGSGS